MRLSTLLLAEGREQDFLKAYGKKFSKEDLKKIYLLSRDIAPNNKFLNFLGKALSPENIDSQLGKAKELLEKFIKYQGVLDQRDINQFNSLDDISSVISSHENKLRRDVKQLEGADQVYEDDTFTVVTPKTHKASCYYGAGTKWCTASLQGDSHFNRYNQDGKLFYIINKKLPTSDRFYKVALLQKYDGTQVFYDAPDQSFERGWILGKPEWEKINSTIQKYMTNNFEREIKIFMDKNAAKIEMERIRQQQERERRARRLAAQEEMRQDQDWNLELHPDSNSVRGVNALYNYLVDHEDVDTEIDDIYHLIPEDYTHYGLTVYVWEGESGPTGNSYAVGNDTEAQNAAEDAVRSLWDENGVEGFSQSFIDNHIDGDQVYDYFYEFWESDIRDNIDGYFDQDDLGLSDSQQKRINQIEEEISEYEHEQYMLDDDREDYQELYDDFQDKIDELNSEKEEIESSPEGEPTEEMIQNEAHERAQEAKDNPTYHIQEFGMEITNFIDVDSLIEDVIDTDGRGISVSYYDGDEHEERINDEWFYIYRID